MLQLGVHLFPLQLLLQLLRLHTPRILIRLQLHETHHAGTAWVTAGKQYEQLQARALQTRLRLTPEGVRVAAVARPACLNQWSRWELVGGCSNHQHAWCSQAALV
jgi:hypothetical protein